MKFLFFTLLLFPFHFSLLSLDSFERSIEEILEKAIKSHAFPGATLVVNYKGKTVFSKAFGTLSYDDTTPVNLDTLFDIASLTKAVGTTAAIMKLCEDKKLSLETSINPYFPQLLILEDADIKVHHLLSHQSGLCADVPLEWFQDTALEKREERIWEFIFKKASIEKPGVRRIYSDVGFILLGKLIEKITELPLETYLDEHIFKPLHMDRTFFCPLLKGYALNEIAPTEKDLRWRKELIHGKVHDEKAEVFKGISGHAGLFSTSRDLERFIQAMLNPKPPFLKRETITHFIERGLGWDLEISQKNQGIFSKEAYSHFGFTGTAIWIDPEKELGIAFLTNRVHPTRDNLQIREVRNLVIEKFDLLLSLRSNKDR